MRLVTLKETNLKPKTIRHSTKSSIQAFESKRLNLVKNDYVPVLFEKRENKRQKTSTNNSPKESLQDSIMLLSTHSGPDACKSTNSLALTRPFVQI